MYINRILCVVGENGGDFYLALLAWKKGAPHIISCKHSSSHIIAEDIKRLIEEYGVRLRFGLVINAGQYQTLHVKQEAGRPISRKILESYLLEESSFHCEDGLWFALEDTQDNSQTVFYTTNAALEQLIKPTGLALKDFHFMDHHAFALAEYFIQGNETTIPVLILSGQDGIVQCTLINQGKIESFKETSLFGAGGSESDEKSILADKIKHYFSSMLDQKLMIVSYQKLMPDLTKLPEYWNTKQTKGGLLLPSDSVHLKEPENILPIIGSGLYHV